MSLQSGWVPFVRLEETLVFIKKYNVRKIYITQQPRIDESIGCAYLYQIHFSPPLVIISIHYFSRIAFVRDMDAILTAIGDAQ